MLLSQHRMPELPLKLRQIHFLSGRMTLSSFHKKQFHQLKQGYIGELFLHRFLSEFPTSEHFHICSLSLVKNQSHYQLDRLLFFKERVFLIEVKHFFGDYLIRDKNCFSAESMKKLIIRLFS